MLFRKAAIRSLNSLGTVHPIKINEIPHEIMDSPGTVKDIEFPRQGHTSDVGIIESTTGRFILKRTKGELYCSWLSQEVYVLNTLHSNTMLPVPNVYQIVEQRNKNQNWALLQYFEGETLRHSIFNETNIDKKHELIFNFGAILSSIHSTPCPNELIGDTVWLDEMLLRAEFNLSHYSVDGTSNLLEFIKHNKPLPIKNTLIHGDFTIDNVLVLNGKITTIIDWSGGGFGDPRYDVALAIRPKPNVFEIDSEIEVFFEGYGTKKISLQEYTYFKDGLNEFF